MARPSWLSGETLLLQSVTSPCCFCVTIEWRGGTEFAFALPGHPYRRLWLSHAKVPAFENGLDSGRYVGGREATWQVHLVRDSCDRGTCVVVISQSTKSNRFVLIPSPPLESQEDSLLQTDRNASAALTVLQVDVDVATANSKSTEPDGTRPAMCQFPTEARMQWKAVVHECAVPDIERPLRGSGHVHEAGTNLDSAALLRFCQDGYLVLPRLAPLDEVNTAKAFIHAQLARLINSAAAAAGSMTVGDRLQPTEDQSEPSAERGADPAGKGGRGALYQLFGASSWQLTALARCAPVLRIVSQLIGHGQVDKTSIGAQVALRFPCVHDDLVASGAAVRTSVSGRDWHTDGMRQIKKHSFSLLVGVALTDMEHEDNGNLCVWPSSHFFCHARMRHPDGKIWRVNENAELGGSWEAGSGPLPDLGPPTQLRLRAGDVVVAHSELAHCGGPHLGPDIRTMVYFRIRHRDWPRMRKEASLVSDMWIDLEGVHGLREEGLLPETPAPEGWQLDLDLEAD